MAATQPSGSTWPLSQPTPYFIYFPASTDQNRTQGFYLGTYPESFDFLHYLFWRNNNYEPDPLLDWPKGIPYQIAHTRTHVVSVIPCIYFEDAETGHYNNGDFIVESLEEIQAIMFRKKGLFICLPSIDRVALGGFSAGTQLVSNTWWKIFKHPFGISKLQEMYVFDPNMNDSAVLEDRVATVESFLTSGGQNKMGRVYTQIGSSVARTRLQSFLGVGSPSLAGPVHSVRIADSSNGNRTAAVVPKEAWPALDGAGNQVVGARNGDDTHQMIPGTMLADALVRSGFKKGP